MQWLHLVPDWHVPGDRSEGVAEDTTAVVTGDFSEADAAATVSHLAKH